MNEDKELVSLEAELVPTNAAGNIEVDAIFSKMNETIEQAVMGLLTQNTRDVDIAARTADALYAQSKPHVLSDDQHLLDVLRHVTALYTPLVRALVFQTEGRFSKARDEIGKGLATSHDALAIIEEYEQLPSADKELIEIYRPIFRIFPTMFRGMDAYVQADIVGYQGNIRQYKELLRTAVEEYRKADRLPLSLNPMFLTLVNMITTVADRLETRIEVFDSKQEQRYQIPTGDRIFIIHGHDEAKWRELRDLLEDRLNLKTIVLKEEPGAGETLIRKFEDFAHGCGYAFALLTPDDFVDKEGKSYFQARPNVLFELGWFYGHFSRDRVCIVKKAETVMPSDLSGILSIDFHKNVSEGLAQIQDELERVGVIKPSDRK